MVFASIYEHASSALISASSKHFVNFPPAGISLLLKRCFAPSNLADTFKTGQQAQG